MKKWLFVCACLPVMLLAAGAFLVGELTAAAAPQLEAEPPDALPGQLLQAMLTGEEVAITQAQLNGLLALLPEEEGLRLLGVELTGENAAVVWAEAAVLGRPCHVQVPVSLGFSPATTELCCTLGEVRVGRVPVPEKLVARLLEESRLGLDFSGKSIIINGEEIIRAALQTDAAVIQNLRCDEHAVYLTPMSAGGLLGSLLGQTF